MFLRFSFGLLTESRLSGIASVDKISSHNEKSSRRLGSFRGTQMVKFGLKFAARIEVFDSRCGISFNRVTKMFSLNQIETSAILGIGMPGWPEMLMIGGIFVLLFGGAKLPGLMRNLGRSVNEFKAGIKEPVDSKSIVDGSEDEAT